MLRHDRTKDQPLSINTEQARKWTKPPALQERTNSVTPNLYEQGAATVSFTPGTSFTFGVPFAATIRSPPVAPSVYDSEEKEQHRTISTALGEHREHRRLVRYSVAEGNLATMFQKCNAETSAQELQICALERATSILNSHAEDARDRAAKLQTILANREMEPVAFETLKRERWMEEQRQLAVDHERKMILQHLDTLTKPLHDEGTPAEAPVQASQVRRHTNLVRFLEFSQTHRPIPPHPPTSNYVELSSRRRTVDKTSPMRLRTSTILDSSETAKRHLRSISLDGIKLVPQSTRASTRSQSNTTTKPNLPSSLCVVIENYVANMASSYTCTTTAVSDRSTLFDPFPSTPLTTASITFPDTPVPATLICKAEVDPDNEGGTVTIFNTIPHINPVDLLHNIHISLPDYAVELFNRFEADATPLQPIFPSLTPQTTARVLNNTAPSNSPPSTSASMRESSFLQVPSPLNPQGSNLGRSNSYRNLGSLFSIPEALSSRVGVEKTNRSSLSSGFFMRRGHGIVVDSPAMPSIAPGSLDGVVITKVRKRFSILRRH